MEKNAERALYGEIGDMVRSEGPLVAIGDDIQEFTRQLRLRPRRRK